MPTALSDASQMVFWTSLAVLAYSYAGYPALILASIKLRRRQPCLSSFDDQDLPEVTVLIVAYNAAAHIEERVRNVLACDYPADRLHIVVASDGSSDATVALVEGMGNPRVRGIAYSARRGKTQTLTNAMQEISTEVVLFTDATNRFDRDSIKLLARHFANPSVGIVTGQVQLIDERGFPVESAYWRNEMLIRQGEMQWGVMLGANGPIYAMRRTLFVEPSRPIINDDFVLPMLAHLRYGCQIVYEESAKAYMLSSGGLASEFRRRARIGAGAFQCLGALAELWQPRHAARIFAFVSHKLLRWLGPFLLLAAFWSSLCLAYNPTYRLFCGLQLAAYLVAIAGLYLPHRELAMRPNGGIAARPNRGIVTRGARLATSFLVMNAALLVGFFRWLGNPGNVLWNPTHRPVMPDMTSVPTNSR